MEVHLLSVSSVLQASGNLRVSEVLHLRCFCDLVDTDKPRSLVVAAPCRDEANNQTATGSKRRCGLCLLLMT